ncbi:unnamed protein product [Brassica rapa subsp. narinosa]
MSAFQAGGNFLMLYKRHVRWQNSLRAKIFVAHHLYISSPWRWF